jgi:hypothetical protein
VDAPSVTRRRTILGASGRTLSPALIEVARYAALTCCGLPCALTTMVQNDPRAQALAGRG